MYSITRHEKMKQKRHILQGGHRQVLGTPPRTAPQAEAASGTRPQRTMTAASGTRAESHEPAGGSDEATDRNGC